MQYNKEIFSFLLLFLSAFKLSDITYHNANFLIPQSSVYVGELVFINDEATYLLGNKVFSKFNDMQFAVVPLSKTKSVRITKLGDEKATFYHKLFGGKIYTAEIQILSLERPELVEDNHLRIPANIWQRVNNDEQIQKDRARLQEVLGKTYDNNDLECMQMPLGSVRVSKFAAPRTLPSGRSYYHSGMDLRSRSPEPIRSIASGQVILAEHMTSPGNMVIVHHGEGLISRYMHLSKISVAVGEQIKQGDTIGLSGGTGRVEAPHLHWEIMWKGNHANPEHFLPYWNRHLGCST